jgi:NADH-quinone oxidoreductase subunit G
VDLVHPYDILAMNGASAALAISPIPVEALVGAVRVGKLDGDFVVNPEEEQLSELEMDLIVSGSAEAILMVECGAHGVTEAEVLDALTVGGRESGLDGNGRVCSVELRDGPSVILAGGRLAGSKGAFSSVLKLAETTGARVSWVPGRAGERGALEAGCLPGLLPGGRPVTDAAARVDVGAAWEAGDLPAAPGRDLTRILRAARQGDVDALVVGGVELSDLPDPELARAALQRAPFVVSLEQRASEVTELADVVFPVAVVAEKPGTFVNWEGRIRPFEAALTEYGTKSDLWVLAGIADELGAPLGFTTVAAARRELTELGAWDGERAAPPNVVAAEPAQPGPGEAVLATWQQLLDNGRLQDGDPNLAATARPAFARLSKATAGGLGLEAGQPVSVSTDRGQVVLPLELADLPDGVVWLPTNSAGSRIREVLGVDAGAIVSIGGAA